MAFLSWEEFVTRNRKIKLQQLTDNKWLKKITKKLHFETSMSDIFIHHIIKHACEHRLSSSSFVFGFKCKEKLLFYWPDETPALSLSSTPACFHTDKSRKLQVSSFDKMLTKWIQTQLCYTMKFMCPSAPVTITSIQMRMASGDGATM